MNSILDTSGYSALLRGNKQVVELLERSQYIYIPIVVIGELRTGFAHGTKNNENKKNLDRFLSDPAVSILYLTDRTTETFSDIYVELRRNGTPIGQNDLWISALAREHGFTVITADADFSRVQGIDCIVI